jgi:hypothetical protein
MFVPTAAGSDESPPFVLCSSLAREGAMSACDEEPCKSLIDEFWARAIAAGEAQLLTRLHCDVHKAALRGYALLFSLWLAVFASALACQAFLLPPILCATLVLAAMLLLAALLVWGVRLWILERILRRHQAICRRRHSEMLSTRRAIAVRCPRECMPPWVKIDCNC